MTSGRGFLRPRWIHSASGSGPWHQKNATQLDETFGFLPSPLTVLSDEESMMKETGWPFENGNKCYPYFKDNTGNEDMSG